MYDGGNATPNKDKYRTTLNNLAMLAPIEVTEVNTGDVEKQAETCVATELHYTCFCTAVNKVLVFGRCCGILPLVPSEHEPGKPTCRYRISGPWLGYSVLIQILYVSYVAAMYFSRISCGPIVQATLEWYVMTFGYFVTDLDSIFALFFGAVFARRSAQLLEKMSIIPGFVQIEPSYNLQRFLVHGTWCLMAAFVAMMSSYSYVAYLRNAHNFHGNFLCTMADRPFAVILRGVTIIFPTIQIAIVMMIILVIKLKFLTLSKSTELALNTVSSRTPCIGLLLERLSMIHKDITHSVKELNNCMGLQSLIAISSSLYNTIYYLYRYNTATDYGLTSNYDERIHYIVGLFYRTGKLLVYMSLGQILTSSSLGPLEVLQSANIINLPTRVQQQVQTLILQWQSKKNIFSAVGVINIGPWLLAPILGNVVTYLLVALQFRTPSAT